MWFSGISLLPKMQLASGQFLAHSQWSTIATMWDLYSPVSTAMVLSYSMFPMTVPELDSSSRCLQQLGLQPPALLLSHHPPVTFQTQSIASYSILCWSWAFHPKSLPGHHQCHALKFSHLDTDTCSSFLSWFDKHLLSNLIPVSPSGTRCSLSYNLLNWWAEPQFPMLNS